MIRTTTDNVTPVQEDQDGDRSIRVEDDDEVETEPVVFSNWVNGDRNKLGSFIAALEESALETKKLKNSDSRDNDVKNNNEPEGQNQFPMDIFSMMFFASLDSLAFFYGMMVFLVQMTILASIYVDLTKHDDERPSDDKELDKNLLNIPVDVDSQVRVAQVIAILVATLSNTDVTESLQIFSVGWQPYLTHLFPSATKAKFIVTNLCRIIEGSCVILASFIFIVQAKTVLDIFMNFAAVQFVATLDDLAYELAKEGWVGKSLKNFNASIADIPLPTKRQKTDGILIGKPALVMFVLTCLFGTYGYLARRQKTGIILEDTSCGIVKVTFGDQVYAFSEEDEYIFQTASASKVKHIYEVFEDESIADTFCTIAGSGRLIGFDCDKAKAPDLHYAYFSGTYHADFRTRRNNRPTYYEDDYHDITAGMFYYCDNEKSWVFTIRAFMETGAIPKRTMDLCKYGWLMRSPMTDAFTLDEAPSDGWKVWTGILDDANDFSATCTECRSDLDCGTSARGTCNENRECSCIENVTEGHFCNEDAPCNDLLLFLDGDDHTEGTIHPNVSSGITAFHTYRNIRSNLSGDGRIHERPAYFVKYLVSPYTDDTNVTVSHNDIDALYGDDVIYDDDSVLGDIIYYEVIFYAGRRWYDVLINSWKIPIEAPDTAGKREFFKRFHAYWNNVLLDMVKWISEPTASYMPTGPIKWYEFSKHLSMGNYGPFPARYEFAQRLECYSVDCDIALVCGVDGNCTERDIKIEPDGYELRGNECVCNEATLAVGHFCEFSMPTNLPTDMPTSVPLIEEEEASAIRSPAFITPSSLPPAAGRRDAGNI